MIRSSKFASQRRQDAPGGSTPEAASRRKAMLESIVTGNARLRPEPIQDPPEISFESRLRTQAAPVAPARTARIAVRQPAAGLQSERYIKDNLPTGVLLTAVAALKGMNPSSVAMACGMPEPLMRSLFGSSTPAAAQVPALEKICSILGIDMHSMTLCCGRVHVFHLPYLSVFSSKEDAQKVMRGVGLLARGARVAEIVTNSGGWPAFLKRRLFVAQSENFRAIFTSPPWVKFSIECIPSATWVRGKEADSVVTVANPELVAQVKTCDLTEAEFDELFAAPSAITLWDDVHAASRANGISKAELMDFIQSRRVLGVGHHVNQQLPMAELLSISGGDSLEILPV